MKQFSAKKLCCHAFLNSKKNITILNGVVIFLLFISAGATARTNNAVAAPGKTSSVNTPPPGCVAGFTDSTSDRVAYFTSTSTDTNASTEYRWNFGDGGISHQKNAVHRFATGGDYTVCLTIINSAISCFDSVCHTVTITQCQAAFDTTVTGNLLTVASTSSGVDANTTYTWNFGDGAIGHQANQTHTYLTGGTYNVCLTITNTNTGCSSQFCENVTTLPFVSSCQAAFSSSPDALRADFTNASTGTSINTTYTWSFGDGSISHQTAPTHLYASAGTYTACLTILNAATGCFDSVCHSVTVTQCQAAFDTSSNGNTITVTSTSTGVDVNTIYTWNFGDGGIGHRASQSHTYTTPGTYNVCLTITNTITGCSSTFCENVTTAPFVTTCTAAFGSSTDDLVANFTNASTGTNVNTKYTWSFGDGGISHEISPTHRYTGGTGNYTACLTILNTATGCFDSVCHTVTITQCQAAFDTAVNFNTITVTSASTGVDVNTVYTWSFGDGGIGHQASQSHTYATPGIYNVCLTISNTVTGCSSQFCENVSTAAFVSTCTASFDTSVTGNVLTVTSTSTGVNANTKYTWNFGDGGIGHSPTQSHTYKPSATICSVPITLTNNQNAATSANFQQMITINSSLYSSEEESGLQNIEFTTGANGSGTPLQAWIESGDSSTSTNTVYWVNMGSSIIPANGTLKIYMTFMSSSILSAAGPTGEAPQLSTTYGQYDNGALVFTNFYDNFAGTSLSSNWSNTGAAGVAVNNGLTLSYQGPNWYGIYTNTFSSALNTVAESYCSAASTSGQGVCINASGTNGNGIDNGSDGIDAQLTGPSGSGYMFGGGGSATSAPNANLTLANASPAANTYYVLSFYMASTPFMQLNYGAFNTLICTPGGDDISANSEVGLGVSGGNGSFQWFRDRAYPPNGVMPTATEASLSCQTLTTKYDVCLTITNDKTGCSSTTCDSVTIVPLVSTCTASFDTLVVGNQLTVTSTSTGVDNNTVYDWNFGDGGIGHQSSQSHTYSVTPTKICYIPVILTNNQSTATSTNFQQLVIVNSATYSSDEQAGLQNIEFTTGPAGSGTPLQAWIESGNSSSSTNTVYWLNMGSSTIPANGTLTVYMNFMPTSVLSATGPTGEAPQLSGTYGQYDNGSLVFPTFYDNFAGTSLNTTSNWTIAAGGTTPTVNNLLTLTSVSNVNWWGVYTQNTNLLGSVVDAYVESPGEPQGIAIATNGLAYQFMPDLGNLDYGTGGSVTSNPTGQSNGGGSCAYNTWYTFSASLNNSAPVMDINYNNSSLGGSEDVAGAPLDNLMGSNTPVGLGVSGSFLGNAPGDFEYVQWFRDRTSPPNGVMPSTMETSMACSNTFDVCLTIFNSATGCNSTTCETVTLLPPAPSCQASFDTSVNYRTLTVTSTSTGVNANTIYTWDFGDGTTGHQPTQSHTYPAKGVCSSSIVLTNNQSSATPTGFQQQVIVNSSLFSKNELAGLQNVEFTAGGPIGTGTPLDAWLESGDSSTSTNSVWWVNLGSNIIPANSTLTIYINFMASNVMSASGVTGEAPQLSTTYGQFDNGALVFPFYDNFAGTTLSNNWSTPYSSGSGTLVVNNGLTITSEFTDAQAANVITSVNSFAPNVIAETYAGNFNSPIGGSRSYTPGLISESAVAEGVSILDDNWPSPPNDSYVAYSNGRAFGQYTFLQGTPTSPSPYADYNEGNPPNPPIGNNVIGLSYTGSANSLYVNYTDVADGNSQWSPSGNLYFALGIAEYGAGQSSTFTSYWARTRDYAPNGVMPGANIGSLSCQAALNKYNVCLTIVNKATGCNSTTCDSVTLLPFVSSCQAAFSSSDTNLVATFTNASTGTDINTTYTWNFGDGGISHQQNPMHRYTSGGGTYTACLTIQNTATGCFDSVCHDVTITQCQASFDTSVNFRTVQFTSTSTDTTDSTHYFWSFGDGGISHQQNPTHTYSDTAKSSCFAMITVSNAQNAATSAGFQQQVVVNSSQYTASELAGLQNIEFTVGGPAGAGTPLNAWLESGNTNISTNTIWWVNLGNTIIPANGNLTLYMNFMGNSVMSASGITGEAPQLSVTYGQFDNGALVFPFYDNFAGTTLNATNWNSYITSGSSGSVVVNNGLTMTSGSNNTDANVISSNITFDSLVGETYAQGSGPVSGARSYMPGLITTTATSEGDFIADQNNNLNCMATSNGQNGVVVYSDIQGNATSNFESAISTPSGYNIIGLSFNGSNNEWDMNYSAQNNSGSFSPTAPVYLAIGLGDYGESTASTISAYWARARQYPPDGSMPGTNAGAISCEAPGTFDVCLTISNSVTGCSSQFCENVKVTPAVNVCGADFTNTTGSKLVLFTSTSTDTTVFTKYKWTFGDGGISHQVNPQHTYADTGMFTVCLTITDSSETFCDSTFCNTIHVTNVNVCGADFTESSNGTLAQFTNTSTGTTPNTQYKWTFGDGGISHQVNPQHIYGATGRYEVCLTITDSAGAFCDSTFCDSITITSPVNVCGADFTFTANGLDVNFTNTSTGTTSATQYRWHFGDNSGKDSISHQKNPLHKFKQPGTYTVCLTITDSTLSFCDSTICKNVTVSNPVSECTANFIWVNVKGQGVHFYSTSQDTTNATKYSWNLGDGTVLQNEVDPAHRYAKSGTYYVCLTITDSTETYCNSTFCDSVMFVLTGIDQLSFPGTSLYYDESTSQIVMNWVGSDNVTIHLVDILGRNDQDIYAGNLSTGTYRFNVNSSLVATGIYFVHMTATDGDKAWKIFVLPH